MNLFTHLLKFVQHLFDEKEIVKKAKPIIEGILKARSVKRLLNMVEQLSRDVRELQAENQRLRDENKASLISKGIKHSQVQRRNNRQRQNGAKSE